MTVVAIFYSLFFPLLPYRIFERRFALLTTIGFLFDITIVALLLLLISTVPNKTLALIIPYFVTILIAALCKRLYMAFIAALAGAVCYGIAVLPSQTGKPVSTETLLWFAFFYISALTAGYLSEVIALYKQFQEEEKKTKERNEIIKNTTAALQRTLSLYEALTENSPNCFVVCNTSGKVVLCNQKFCDLIGSHRDELARAGLFEISQSFIELSFLKENIETSLKINSPVGPKEILLTTKDGQKITLLCRVIPLFEERESQDKLVLVILEDITIKKTEEERKLRLAKLSGGLALLGAAISNIEESEPSIGTVTEAIKQNAHKVIDFTAMAILDLTSDTNEMKVLIRAPVGERFIETLKEKMSATVSTVAEKTIPKEEFKLKLEGVPIEPSLPVTLESFVAVPLLKGGQVCAIFSFSSTLPDHFSTEEIQIIYALVGFYSLELSRIEAIREAAAKEAEAKETEAKLRIQEEMIGHLRKMDALKEGLLITISHQLKTPLSMLKSSVQFLKDGGKLSSEEFNFVNIAAKNVERLERIIEEIVTLTKLETGKVELKIVYAPLRPVISEVLATLEPIAKNKQIVIEPLNLQKEYKAYFDGSAVTQILSNLVSNAILHNPPNTRVKVDVQEEDSFVKISVCDNGVGIPEDALSRVFDKLFQTEKTLKEGTRGMGLGLVVSKRLVEALGGRIWIESNPNRGTTVSFTLKTS